MKTVLLSLMLCLAIAGVCTATMPDEYRLRLMTPAPDPAFQTSRSVAVGGHGLATIALPTTDDAATNEPPAVLSFVWTASAVTSSNGAATGYLLWRSSAGAPATLVLATGLTQADVDYAPGIYYVSATNQFGASAMSMGLVVPKPTTNILSFGSSITNWPTLSWTNRATAAVFQFYAVRYTTNNGKACVVFSSDLLAPKDAWEVFTLWPVITTTNRNIKLFWRQETL